MSKALTLSSRISRSTTLPPVAGRLRNYATSAREPTELNTITTLSNGIRVATESLPGHFSGVGVYVDAGSRYENEGLRGVSHIIDRLAFKSTTRRSADEMLE